MSELESPESWASLRLGLMQFMPDGQVSSPKEVPIGAECLVELEDISPGSRQTSFDRPIPTKFSTKNAFREGDVLYGKLRPYLNKCVVAKKDGICTSEIIPIRTHPILPNFVEFFLRSSDFLRFASTKVHGARMPRLGREHLAEKEMPLPPIGEQKRIVAKIESCFSKIDEIGKSVSDIRKKSKDFALSFLNSHQFWNGNYKSLGDFYRERSERFGKHSTKVSRKIGVSNEFGVVDLRSDESVGLEKYKWVYPGDLFYNPMRLNVGSIAYYDGTEPALTSPDYIVVQPVEAASNRLLFDYLKSEIGLGEIKKRTKGAVRERVYFSSLAEINFPEISFEAHAFAEDSISSIAKQIEELNKLKGTLQRLRESILNEAFSGQLVPQDSSEGTGHDLLLSIANTPRKETDAPAKKSKKRAKV